MEGPLQAAMSRARVETLVADQPARTHCAHPFTLGTGTLVRRVGTGDATHGAARRRLATARPG